MRTLTLRDELGGHRFFADLPGADLDLLAGCGRNVAVPAGAPLAREGEAADTFFIVRAGRVAVQIEAPRGPLTVQTLGAGDVLGWSWLFPPHRWRFSATALEGVRVVALDGACLRGKCDADPALGYRLVLRFARLLTDDLAATRMRLVDLYGGTGEHGHG